MAKTAGPLLSVDAHGSISKTLTFSHRKTGKQARLFNRPHIDPTEKQIERRILNEYATAMWLGMSTADQDAWKSAAMRTGLNIAGFHYFLRRALRDPAAHMKVIVCWPCVRAIGTTCPDPVNSSRNGTLSAQTGGVIPAVVDHPSKKRRHWYEFTDNKSYIVIAGANLPNWDKDGKYSWVITISQKGGTDNFRHIEHYSEGVRGYQMGFGDPQQFRLRNLLDYKKVRTIKTFSLNTKYHLVYTYDGSGGGLPTIHIYVDGIDEPTTNDLVADFVSTSNDNFYMGEWQDRYSFEGYGGGLLYLNRIITANEAKYLAQFSRNKLSKSPLIL